MIKKLIRLLLLYLLVLILLGLGGYSLNSFKHEVHLKDPSSTLSPVFNAIPDLANNIAGYLPGYENASGKTDFDINIYDSNDKHTNIDNNYDFTVSNNDLDLPDFSTDPEIPDFANNNDLSIPDFNTNTGTNTTNTDSTASTNPYVDENGNVVKTDIKLPSTIEVSYIKLIRVKLDNKVIELSSSNTVEFVRWLNKNYKPTSEISYEVENVPETISTNSSDPVEVTYESTLNTNNSNANLTALVNSINVIDSLPSYNDYDRNTFEKPTQSYTLNGKKTNRNDYAWKTSPWYNAENNTYTCPYTGKVIYDLDDKKEDNDFGNVDYDHIVPLKSAYLRGARDWTEEQRNAYAYDQWVGVDVLNSANRSKSDKGPCDYLPSVNVEDYCYSWLMICSKYNLVMTQEEIDLCVEKINTAIKNGEEVTFLGGSYEE